jgi:hypothetical protein
MTRRTAGLSPEHTNAGKLQRAVLELLGVHELQDTLPTSARFLFYELIQAGVISKHATGKRRADQSLNDALIHLREIGEVPWDFIVDETRSLDAWRTAPSVAEYVAESVAYARINPWGEEPAPLILCESRSLAGVLNDLASAYACPIASTNGQCRGFLITEVVPTLHADQRVLYLGDWDRGGHQIEASSRRTIAEHTGVHERPWERIALTTEQVEENDLPIIAKLDRRYGTQREGRYFDAVETEAFGQANIVAALRDRLDELMPEPLDDGTSAGVKCLMGLILASLSALRLGVGAVPGLFGVASGHESVRKSRGLAVPGSCYGR